MEILKKLPFDLQEHILVNVMKRYKLRQGKYVRQIDKTKYTFLEYIIRPYMNKNSYKSNFTSSLPLRIKKILRNEPMLFGPPEVYKAFINVERDERLYEPGLFTSPTTVTRILRISPTETLTCVLPELMVG